MCVGGDPFFPHPSSTKAVPHKANWQCGGVPIPQPPPTLPGGPCPSCSLSGTSTCGVGVPGVPSGAGAVGPGCLVARWGQGETGHSGTLLSPRGHQDRPGGVRPCPVPRAPSFGLVPSPSAGRRVGHPPGALPGLRPQRGCEEKHELTFLAVTASPGAPMGAGPPLTPSLTSPLSPPAPRPPSPPPAARRSPPARPSWGHAPGPLLLGDRRGGLRGPWRCPPYYPPPPDPIPAYPAAASCGGWRRGRGRSPGGAGGAGRARRRTSPR